MERINIMKKRLISILLALILTLQLGITAFADTETPIVSPTDVDIYGVSIVLSGEIGLTFHVKVGKPYWGGTMELKFKEKEDSAPITLNIKDCPSEGLTLFTATYYLSAIELSEPVMITVFDANHKMLAQDSCSAQEYVNLLRFDKKATEKEKKVGISLIKYGHYAQLACSETNGWEIGKDYKETTCPETDELQFDAAVFDDYEIIWKNHTAEFNQFLMSLQLDYKTGIHLYLPLKDKPTVTVNGEAVEVTVSERYENYYETYIDGINAFNLEEEYEVTVNDVTFTLSAFSFCNLVVSNGGNENTVNAMRALYEFYQAIIDYKTAKGVSE
ncbi:MAG: hypothetical protein MJ080_02265 [Clostridia bacterium]|nr:hypothetical protein [Clostridia bacterium]